MQACVDEIPSSSDKKTAMKTCMTDAAKLIRSNSNSGTKEKMDDVMLRARASSYKTVPSCSNSGAQTTVSWPKGSTGDTQQKKDKKTCRDNARTAADKFGSKRSQTRGDQARNAVRTAADKHANCKDAGNTDTECDKQAQGEFDAQSRNEGRTDAAKTARTARWKKLLKRVRALSKAKRNGELTKIVRRKEVDVQVDVQKKCSQIKQDGLKKNVETNAKSFTTGKSATVEKGDAYDSDTNKCTLKFTVKVASKTSDTDIQKLASDFAGKSLTVPSRRTGRALLGSSEVFASQGASECPSSGCDGSSSADGGSSFLVAAILIVCGTVVVIGAVVGFGVHQKKKSREAHHDAPTEIGGGSTSAVVGDASQAPPSMGTASKLEVQDHVERI